MIFSSLLLSLLLSFPPAEKPAPVSTPSYGGWHSCLIGGGGYVQGVTLSPSDPNRAYAYVDVGGVFRSDDGGKKWAMIHGALPSNGVRAVRGISLNPKNANDLLAGVGDQWHPAEGIFRTKDGGKTWRKTLSAAFYGNEDYRWAGDVFARDPNDPQRIFAASGGTGVFMSKDGGDTWAKLGLEGILPTDLKFDAVAPRRLWLCALPITLYPDRKLSGGFYRSEDGGKTWLRLSDKSPQELVQDPKSPDRLYAIFDGAKLCVSEDAGKTWRDDSDGLDYNPADLGDYVSERRYNALAVREEGLITASSRGTFYTRRFGEKHWTKVVREGVTEIYCGLPWYGQIKGPGQWQHFGAALGSITVDPFNSKRWFFTDWYAVYRSEDEGKHWNLSMDNVEVTVLHCLSQSPGDPKVVHLGMADNGYFRSATGGERFTHGAINSNMKCLVPVLNPASQMVYGVGDGSNGQWVSNTLWVSEDGGKTWAKREGKGLPNSDAHHFVSLAVRGEAELWVTASGSVQSGGGIYHSTDSGKTWSRLSEGLPESEDLFAQDIWVIGREIAADRNGTVYAVSRSKNRFFVRFSGAARWEEMKPPFNVGVNDLLASPTTPGTVFAASDGVWKSQDFGKTWTKLVQNGAMHLAIDLAHPQRIAAGTETGVFLSRDSGKTWNRLGPLLPSPLNPVVAFAGNRVLAGTGGNGAFWIEIGD